MKIYAITKGIYSDYHICALTVDKDKAERLRVIYSDEFNEAEIEEYEDGEGQELRVMWMYDSDYEFIDVWDFEEKEGVSTYTNGDIWRVFVYAPDSEHARKKAQDMIAEYKAQQEGIC